MGLTPIVVHGAGPQLDNELAAAGIEKQTIDGLRVTSSQALGIVRRVLQTQNLKLVEALQEGGTRATSITAGVFESDYVDRTALGLVGKVNSVNLAPIEASLQAGSIPVIASMGETVDGQILNINADFAANELVKVLQPYKIIFLTGTGGLLDGEGRVIDSISLSSEYQRLIAQPWLHSGMCLKIEQIKDLLDELPLTSSVSITRPAELAKELFTHKGSGTLIRRGERVAGKPMGAVGSCAPAQPDRVELLARVGAGLLRTQISLRRAYVSENYRAALILVDGDGLPYLDKFAVLEDAQGEGLGRAVGKSCAPRPRSCTGDRAWAIRSTPFITASRMAAASTNPGACSGTASRALPTLNVASRSVPASPQP